MLEDQQKHPACRVERGNARSFSKLGFPNKLNPRGRTLTLPELQAVTDKAAAISLEQVT